MTRGEQGNSRIMPTTITMPALSPTMEEGTLAKWLVKVGDSVASGDLLAEIETDKATMEFEAIDEGVITEILVAAGTEGVKVGQPIVIISGEDDASEPSPAPSNVASSEAAKSAVAAVSQVADVPPAPGLPPKTEKESSGGDRVIASPLAKKMAAEMGVDIAAVTGTGPGGRIVKADIEAAAASGGAVSAPAATPDADDVVIASPLAKRLAREMGVDLSKLTGTGPRGRIVKADIEAAAAGGTPAAPAPVAAPAPSSQVAAAPTVTAAASIPDFGIPHQDIKLSGMRKTIARRLAQSMAEAPHIYLTLDVRLDALLKLRGELNDGLAARGIKLSVNDMLIKALALALEQVPQCNVSFGGDSLRQYARADISVAVSIPGGLITPIITDAASKSLSKIAAEAKDLAGRAKEGKLKPEEYVGGTASISNMGMMGIKHFTAVINPPQAMILAVGAGEKRPYIVDDALSVATVMTVTGSFDHRAIDGADGAQLMAAFKALVEKPMGLVA